MNKSRSLAKERRIETGAWRGKNGLHSEERQAPGKREGKQRESHWEK